ncbi:MAG: helix-turn-helix transcriptional regulator [Proteobacteria bacterium]|nr:helix-turn-helix transcriptional regulator [Pseudomonadota bacterium]
MTDANKLLHELRSGDRRFDEAQAVVEFVRSAARVLADMRERAGWTQAQLADYLGVTVGRVSQLESGALRHAPSLKMMARIAFACRELIDVSSVPLRTEAELLARAELTRAEELAEALRREMFEAQDREAAAAEEAPSETIAGKPAFYGE